MSKSIKLEERFDEILEELIGQTDYSNYIKSYHAAKLKAFIKQEIALAVQQRDEEWESKLKRMVQYDDSYLGTVVFSKDVADIINLIKLDHE